MKITKKSIYHTRIAKLLLLSVYCFLAFCSCQKDAEHLCWGYWKVDTNASYIIEQGKRHYFSEMKIDDVIPVMQFDTEGNVNIFLADGTNKSAKCHFDKDCFIAEGEIFRVIQSSPLTMTIESVNNDSNDFAHIILERDVDNSDLTALQHIGIYFAYYRLNVPY